MSIHRIWKNKSVFLGRLTIDTQCKKDHVIAGRAKPDVAIPFDPGDCHGALPLAMTWKC